MNGFFATLLFEDSLDNSLDDSLDDHHNTTPLPKAGPVADLESNTPQDNIDIVVSQTNVSRLMAVETLIKNGGDIVDSIMYLTDTTQDDVETVMRCAQVSREVAIQALKKVQDDPVNAVLVLTTT